MTTLEKTLQYLNYVYVTLLFRRSNRDLPFFRPILTNQYRKAFGEPLPQHLEKSYFISYRFLDTRDAYSCDCSCCRHFKVLYNDLQRMLNDYELTERQAQVRQRIQERNGRRQ